MPLDAQGFMAAMDDADQLVQVASALRSKFVLHGWSTGGAESITELLISATLAEVSMAQFSADDEGDDDVVQ